MFVYSGGTANHTTIANGGHLWIDNAAADNTTVNSGGVLMVYLSGKANNVQVDSDGCLYVYSGGIVNDAAIHSSGYANIYSGGIANRITVNTSGYFNIGSNGTANKTEIRSGGYAAVYGKAVDLDVKYGGSAYIRENAVCSGTINVGGKMTAASADDISPAKSVNFILGAAPQSGAYLTINEGNLENTMTVSADITQACGTYTLMKGGAGSLSSITIKYDEQNTRLFVGITITVTADVSAQLIRSGSDLKITVQVNDTIPPVVPSGVSGTLKDNVLSVSWNEVTDRTGVSYEIEYSKDGSFASGVHSIVSTSLSAEINLGNGDWYWRIRAVDGAGNKSGWSAASKTTVNYTAVLEGIKNGTQNFYGDVIIKDTADVTGSYPAAVRINSDDSTVTVEGGTLSCSSIRNAAILFGEDTYWVNQNGYGEHYNGTVTFTGAAASLYSSVSNCITAAGIAGKNLTVNFSGQANRSAGIVIRAEQGTGPGNYACSLI